MASFISDQKIIGTLRREGAALSLAQLMALLQVPADEAALFHDRLMKLAAAAKLLCETGEDGEICFLIARHESGTQAFPPQKDKMAKQLHTVTILAAIGAAAGIASLLWQVVRTVIS